MLLLWLLTTVAFLSPGTCATPHDDFVAAELRKRQNQLAPVYKYKPSEIVPHSWTILFHSGHTLEQHYDFLGKNLSMRPGFTSYSFGYEALLYNNDTTFDLIRSDPGVLLLETTLGLIDINADRSNMTHNDKTDTFASLRKREYGTQISLNAPYGLQQVAAASSLSSPVADGGTYEHVCFAGWGVQAYVLDSGIRRSHATFGSRARNIGNLADTDYSPYCASSQPSNHMDSTGHGTGVASILAGDAVGVAPYADIINVKVACPSISVNNIANAIAAVTTEHLHNKAADPVGSFFRGSLINFSFGWTGTNPKSVEQAVVAASVAGVSLFAAAGNQNSVGQITYPCSLPKVNCIGASDRSYNWWPGSNYGSFVSYIAPGVDVQTASYLDDHKETVWTGTSQACPHAAGTAAIFMSWSGLVNDQAPSYVWWNSLTGLISGVPSVMRNYMINTGIHSPKKFPKEPFRWATDVPQNNHAINNDPTITGNEDSLGTTPLTVGLLMQCSAGSTTAPPISGLSNDGISHTSDEDDVAVVGDDSSSNNTQGAQMIALASYTNPLGDPAAWQRLISYDSSKLSVLVANVLNGPDYVVDQSWSAVIQQAASSGKTVLGYVRTGYLGVSQQQFKTRLGSGNLADWASQIEQDVDKWFELYPGSIGGIFFDEGWPECGPNNIYSDLYAYINAYTKRKHPGAYTVLNPGSTIAQCYEDTMDTLLTFEASYETYTSSAYTDNTWTPTDARKIWHIVYRTPQDQIASVAALARSRHAGYLEVTDQDEPNPYVTVPSDAYVRAAMDAVSGGTSVRKDAAVGISGSYVAGLPGDSNVMASDYTSVTITWSPVANALGYAVYQNGALVLEMPASLTRATIGMLKPGTSSIAFEVRTVLSSGGGAQSRSITASTKSLPSGGSITNVSYKQNGATVVYTADVLVPYAFVRLFIGGPHKAVGASTGWPIDAGINNDTGVGQYKLVNYLVEGNDFYSAFYKYGGSYIEGGAGNADWTWTQQGTAPQSQSGYTYTWNVPLGGTDALPDQYAVQGQGYAPIQNIFGGTLRSNKCDGVPCDDNPAYSCKGSTLCWAPNLLKYCDLAVNNVTRTDALTYTASGSSSQTGVCNGDGASTGCGVFIQGTNCQISGNDLWHDYQNIRKLGGCNKCGSFKRPDGCEVVIDFVSKCDVDAGGAPIG